MSLAFGFRPLILTITGLDSHTILGSETARGTFANMQIFSAELLLLNPYFQV